MFYQVGFHVPSSACQDRSYSLAPIAKYVHVVGSADPQCVRRLQVLGQPEINQLQATPGGTVNREKSLPHPVHYTTRHLLYLSRVHTPTPV